MPSNTQIVLGRVKRYYAKKGTAAIFDKPEYEVGDLVMSAFVMEKWKKFTPGRLRDMVKIYGINRVVELYEEKGHWRAKLESVTPSASVKPAAFASIPAEGYVKIDEVLRTVRGLIAGSKFGF